MLIIFIDTNQRNHKKVILQKVEGDKTTELEKREGDIDIVTAIEDILTKKKLKLKDIDDFGFSQEGGSFTGIKTGAAVANVLKWAVKKVPYEKLPIPEYGGDPNIG